MNCFWPKLRKRSQQEDNRTETNSSCIDRPWVYAQDWKYFDLWSNNLLGMFKFHDRLSLRFSLVLVWAGQRKSVRVCTTRLACKLSATTHNAGRHSDPHDRPQLHVDRGLVHWSNKERLHTTLPCIHSNDAVSKYWMCILWVIIAHAYTLFQF